MDSAPPPRDDDPSSSMSMGKGKSSAGDPSKRLGFTAPDQVSRCELLSRIAGLEDELRQADEDNSLMAVKLAEVKSEKEALRFQVEQLLEQLSEIRQRAQTGGDAGPSMTPDAASGSAEYQALVQQIAALNSERQASRDAERTLQVQLEATRVGAEKLSQEVQRLLTQLNDEQITHQQQLQVAQTTQVQCAKAVEAMVQHLNVVKRHSQDILAHNEGLQHQLVGAVGRIDQLEALLQQHGLEIPIDAEQMHRDAHELGIDLHEPVLPGTGGSAGAADIGGLATTTTSTT